MKRINAFLAKFVGPNAAHIIDAVVAFGQREGTSEITDLRERDDGLGEVRGIGIALLCAELEVEPVLRVIHRDDSRAVAREAQHGIIDQRIADELRGLIIGGGVLVVLVREVQSAEAHAKTLPEELRSQPGFAKIQLVLVLQACGVAVEEREGRDLLVRRRAAHTDDVCKE